MDNTNSTTPGKLDTFVPPAASKKVIYQSVLCSSLLAAGLLAFVILPAEYNVDPTGVGSKLGLTTLSATGTEIATSATSTTSESALSFQADTTNIVLEPGKGIEYKFNLQKNNALNYAWESSGGELYFDLHGEPQGDDTGYFESYLESTARAAKGSFIAPFNGSHGWYWENKGSEDVTITLKTEGDYQILGLK